MSREAFDQALIDGARLTAPAPPAAPTPSTNELVSAKEVARRTSLPLSCIYEYARAGRIPCVRAGKHVRFSPDQVLQALRLTSNGTDGHG